MEFFSFLREIIHHFLVNPDLISLLHIFRRFGPITAMVKSTWERRSILRPGGNFHGLATDR